jgi:hypothetical protein
MLPLWRDFRDKSLCTCLRLGSMLIGDDKFFLSFRSGNILHNLEKFRI